jgi:hypothetical protein
MRDITPYIIEWILKEVEDPDVYAGQAVDGFVLLDSMKIPNTAILLESWRFWLHDMRDRQIVEVDVSISYTQCLNKTFSNGFVQNQAVVYHFPDEKTASTTQETPEGGETPEGNQDLTTEAPGKCETCRFWQHVNGSYGTCRFEPEPYRTYNTHWCYQYNIKKK